MSRKLRVIEVAEPYGVGYYIEEYIATMWVTFIGEDGCMNKRYNDPSGPIAVCESVISGIPIKPETKIIWQSKEKL